MALFKTFRFCRKFRHFSRCRERLISIHLVHIMATREYFLPEAAAPMVHHAPASAFSVNSKAPGLPSCRWCQQMNHFWLLPYLVQYCRMVLHFNFSPVWFCRMGSVLLGGAGTSIQRAAVHVENVVPPPHWPAAAGKTTARTCQYNTRRRVSHRNPFNWLQNL